MISKYFPEIHQDVFKVIVVCGLILFGLKQPVLAFGEVLLQLKWPTGYARI